MGHLVGHTTATSNFGWKKPSEDETSSEVGLLSGTQLRFNLEKE